MTIKKEKIFTIVLMFTKVLFLLLVFLNGLMKILIDLGIFNRVIFKDLGSDCYGKNSIS